MIRVGFCNGVFDDFHDGHRYFLKKARQHCDWLVVAVNSDLSARAIKGEGNPVWPLFCRMSHVRPYAHSIVPFDGTPILLLDAIKPDVLIRGEDQIVMPNEWGGDRDLVVISKEQA